MSSKIWNRNVIDLWDRSATIKRFKVNSDIWQHPLIFARVFVLGYSVAFLADPNRKVRTLDIEVPLLPVQCGLPNYST